jgi:hypothetical protein
VCFTVSSAFDFYEDNTLRWRLRLFAQLFVPTQHPQRFPLIKTFIIALPLSERLGRGQPAAREGRHIFPTSHPIFCFESLAIGEYFFTHLHDRILSSGV